MASIKSTPSTSYAVLVGGSNGDGAWCGLVTIVELIDPRPYIFQVTVYGNLIYTVIYMSDRLLTQANPNPRLLPPPDLRREHSARRGKFTHETRVYNTMEEDVRSIVDLPMP